MGGGRQIFCGAMRRYGDRILYQGSLQYKGGRGNGEFESIIARAFGGFLGRSVLSGEAIPSAIVKEAGRLARERYGSPRWVVEILCD